MDIFSRECSDPAKVFPTNPLEWYQYFTCQVPGHSEQDGIEFLEMIGDPGLGTGIGMTKMGFDMHRFRTEYKRLIRQLKVELEARRAANMPAKEIAKWIVGERTRIARQMRLQQGVTSTVILEVRDAFKYGIKGRSFENLEKKALKKAGAGAYEYLIKSAMRPNRPFTAAVLRGAKFLKGGGVVTLVITVPTELYIILTAPEEELEKVIYQEVGSVLGAVSGSGVAVGLCMGLAGVTSGWGIFACGAIGGIGGGAGGSYLGERLYYSKDRNPLLHQAETRGVLDSGLLLHQMPTYY